VSKDDLIAEIKSKLSSMNNTMSFIIEGADGTVYVKEHLSSSGTEPYDDNTRIHIASGCKWPAMATIMKLVELEKLALDDKVTKYYPDFASSNPGLEI
jgi:CubicO group peptidase (beta-lactamase class C family)